MQFFAPLLALAAVAAAIPTGSTGGSPPAGAQCCQNVKNSSELDSATKGILEGLLDIDISDLNVPIGTGCAPIAILGGVSWYVIFPHQLLSDDADDHCSNTNTVTCGQVYQSALIGINCVPIIINL
jgi:hypothetical protein